MNVTSIDLSAMNTELVTSMEGMFQTCGGLTSLDLSNFNTSSVTNMSYMLIDCVDLTTLDLGNFDTSKVTDMSSMFYGTSSLKEVRVSNLWDMSSVTNTYHMFAGSGVSSVTVV